jgi:hypothetical protein
VHHFNAHVGVSTPISEKEKSKHAYLNEKYGVLQWTTLNKLQ